jgi:hypothetical protein
MKKLLMALAIVIFILSFIASPGESGELKSCYRGWVLYDNFNSGYIPGSGLKLKK